MTSRNRIKQPASRRRNRKGANDGRVPAATAMRLAGQGFAPAPARMLTISLLVAGLFAPPGWLRGVQAQPALPRNATIVQGALPPQVNGAQMVVPQTQSRAIINWESFSIGKGASVRFDQQGNRDWAVLNRVVGNEASLIQGLLQADGSVYLVNRNGIVFGQGAVVDVGSFVASTLNVSDRVFNEGLLSVGDSNPAFEVVSNYLPRDGIRIEPDAVIQAASGGQVFFIASGSIYDANGTVLPGRASIDNQGTIRVADGQVILAAGDKVFLRTPSLTRNARENGFVGLAVQADDGGQVANAVQGIIEAKRGNVTLAAAVVNQGGRITATTSVERDGSIWLLAGQPRAGSGDSARVTLAPGSVTEVLPDVDSAGKTVADAQFRNTDGSLRVPGSTIIIDAVSAGAEVEIGGAQGGRAGAVMRAPGGRVEVKASAGNLIEPPLAGDGSRIVVGRGARIDVAGLRAVDANGRPAAGDGVPVAQERNSVRIELQGEQLADAPLLRDSAIRGRAVLVDARLGDKAAPLINTEALRNALDASVERGIHERLAGGGSVTLHTGGDLIVQPDAEINVAGGAIKYLAGRVDTSRLFDGRRYYAIESAPRDLNYVSVSTVAGRPEAGYTEGQDGGVVTITARNLALNGRLLGGAVAGPRQRRTPPGGGRLVITENPDSQVLPQLDDVGLRHELKLTRGMPGEIVLRAGETIAEASVRLFGTADSPLAQSISLDMLEASGLSEIDVRTNGAITVSSDQTIQLGSDARLALTGEQIDFQASLRSAGGQLALTATNTVYDGGPARLDAPYEDHPVLVGDGVSLDLSGAWINDRAAPAAGERMNPVAGIKPGQVAISSPTGIEFGANTTIKVDSGAWIDPAGALLAGDALLAETGNRSGRQQAAISLQVLAGDDRSPNSAAGGLVPNLRFPVADTRLILPTRMSGYGFEDGAELSLTAARIDIGGNAAAAPNGVALTPAFFETGGFSSYRIEGSYGLAVHDGTQLSLSQRNFMLNLPVTLADGEALGAQVSIVERFDAERLPVDLTLAAGNAHDGIVHIGTAARIDAEAGAAVTLAAGYRVDHHGTIVAPGGRISLSVSGDNHYGFQPDLGVQLHAGSLLDASGVALVATDRLGRRSGNVLAGGSVELSADPGTVIFDQDARIDVSGAAARLDLGDGSGRRAERWIGSAAGNVAVAARVGALLAGRIDGSPGTAGLAGARIGLSFGTSDAPLMVIEEGVTKLVDAGGSSSDNTGDIIHSYFPYGERRFVLGDLADLPTIVGGKRVDLDASFNGARPSRNNDPAWADRAINFWVAGETLAGVTDISFTGSDVLVLPSAGSLAATGSIVLDVPALRMTGGSFVLAAPHLQVGRSIERQYKRTATAASGLDGVLTLQAGHTLDLRGDLRLTGMADARFEAGESLRFTGVLRPAVAQVPQVPSAVLSSAGNLVFLAPRAYPTSVSRYRIESDRTVRFEGDGGQGLGRFGLPFSAYGQLLVMADRIEQSGVLLAPLGQITLTASSLLELGAGSLTSVSGAGLLVPIGSLSNGRDLLYSLGGSYGSLLLKSPAKAVTLEAPAIVSASTATIDASGGGDILAHEFVRGPMGAVDFLDGETYAIVPGYAASARPIDIGAERDTALGIGQTVYLSGIDGLPAGAYTLLPARYALLPGAFALRLTGVRDATAADNRVQRDGVRLVSGYLGNRGAGTADARTQLFEIFDSVQLRERSEYVETTGSALFAAEATRLGQARPELSVDGGTIALAAIDRLDLEARIDLAAGDPVIGVGDPEEDAELAAAARRGTISLAAERLEVVAAGQPPSDPAAVAVSVERLTEIDAGEIALGGRIVTDPVLGTRTLVTTSRQVTIADGVALRAQAVTLAATGQVAVGHGAEVASTLVSGSGAAGHRIDASGDGALLRVGGDAIDLHRTLAGAPAGGDLMVADGARIAGPSVVLDATRRLDLSTQAEFAIGDGLTLGSSAIHVGSDAGTPANLADGLVLDTARLAQLSTLKSLTLSAYRTMAVHGQASLGGAGFEHLVVQSPLIEAAAPGASLALAAGSVEWRSSTQAPGAAPAPVIAGTTITIDGLGGTDRAPVVIGTGDKTLGGFETLTVNAAAPAAADTSGAIGGIVFSADANRATGDGTTHVLRSAGDIVLNADRIAAASLAEHSVEAGGTLTARAVGVSDAGKADLSAGGSLTLSGSSALIDTAIVARSGEISVVANAGTVTVGSRAQLVAGGFERALHDETLRLDGGKVRLEAAGAGDAATPAISVAGGARIDVAAAGGRGGDLELVAPTGTISIDAGAVLTGGGNGRAQGGRLAIDAGQSIDLDRVAEAAGTGGFDREIDLRARSGAMRLADGSVLSAGSVKLSADDGELRIDGRIDARTAAGGRVVLAHAGAGELVLGATALVDARPTQTGAIAAGGKVELHGNDAPIRFEEGARVLASGAGPDAGGELLIRAERDAAGRIDVGGTGSGLAVDAGSRVNVDAYKVYRFISGTTGQIAATGATTATRLAFQAMRTEAENFHANQAAAVAAALPVTQVGGGAADVVVKPGIEIRGARAADITVIQDLDFSTVNTGAGEARTGGYFTVRAEGDLRLQGVAGNATNPTGVLRDGGAWTGAGTATNFTYAPGESWSYRLVAGADLDAANPNAVRSVAELATAGLASKGDFILDPNKRVYTGTGSIEVAAGRDVKIGDSASTFSSRRAASIYTFGRAADTLAGFTPVNAPNLGGRSSYGRDGGDVTVAAGRDVLGSTVGQFASSWLYRQGSVDGSNVWQDIGWWAQPAHFQMNVGALAGGRVNVSAGRDIAKLTAATGATGRLASHGNRSRDQADLLEEGGGALAVTAGRNVAGGHFVAQRDVLHVRAGDSVIEAQGAVAGKVLAPVLGLGSGQAMLAARRDLAFSHSYSTTAVPRGASNNVTGSSARDLTPHFMTWSVDSGVTLTAGGTVRWNENASDGQAFGTGTNGFVVTNLRSPDLQVLQAPSLRATAATGDILVGPGYYRLAPSSHGGLTLLAGGDVRARLVNSDDQASFILPGGEVLTTIGPDRPTGPGSLGDSLLIRATFRPAPAFDAVREPVRIYAGGDVGGSDVRRFGLESSRPAVVKAGRDVVNFTLTGQNLLASDETRIEAGRDIVYSVSRQASGAFDLRNSGEIGLKVGGPGTLVVRAGRDIDLGVSSGVESYGNLRNGDLARGGASIVLIAGQQQDPAYGAVLDSYVKPSAAGAGAHAQELVDYVRAATGDASIADAETAWARFVLLPAAQRDAFARDVFFRELRAAGGPDTAALIARFVAPAPDRVAGGALAAELIAFVNQYRAAGLAPVTDAQSAWTAFSAMPAVRHAEFTGQLLVPTLISRGDLKNDDPMFRDYARGYRAIATMFPTDGAGNLELQFSKVRATQGGAVQVLAAGSVCRDAAGACTTDAAKAAADLSVGQVLAGVANPPPGLNKAPGELGIFGMDGASVQILAGSDVNVFGNRIVTLGGGPLLGWSSFGNIDAGRGSRAAVAAPPPTITIDSSGNIQVALGGAVQGSGIRAVATGDADDELAGEVTLYAPQGFIDAGDAGIQGGAVFVAAAQILNAENIRVGDGITQAVALGDVGGGGLGGISASASAAAGNAAQQAAQQAADSASNRASQRRRVVVVEFEGFGPGVEDEEERRRRLRQNS